VRFKFYFTMLNIASEEPRVEVEYEVESVPLSRSALSNW